MGKIFSEFFTNLAVAWFTSGIIAPLFSPERFSSGFLIMAVSSSALFIFFAILIKDLP